MPQESGDIREELEQITRAPKDLEIRRTPGVDAKISVKDAWNLMNTQNVFTLPITDAESHLQGLITINDIAKSYMDENDSAIVSVARTPYRNIMETLDAEMVVGDPEASFTEGKVVIAAANPDVMENYINPHDMVILGNRYESQADVDSGGGRLHCCLPRCTGLKDHPAHGEGEGNDDPGHSARHVYGSQADQPIDANRFLYEVGQSDYVSSGRLYRPDQGDHVEEEVPRFPGS